MIAALALVLGFAALELADPPMSTTARLLAVASVVAVITGAALPAGLALAAAARILAELWREHRWGREARGPIR